MGGQHLGIVEKTGLEYGQQSYYLEDYCVNEINIFYWQEALDSLVYHIIPTYTKQTQVG